MEEGYDAETIWEPSAKHTCWHRTNRCPKPGVISVCNTCGTIWLARHDYPFFIETKWVRLKWWHLRSQWRRYHG